VRGAAPAEGPGKGSPPARRRADPAPGSRPRAWCGADAFL